jgi:general secretion pathway protein D
MKRRPCITAILLLVLLLAPLSPAGAQEAKTEGGVIFNFVDVDISAVAKFVSDITGKNFIFDERVRGKITIIAPSKLSVDDAYNLFTSVLQLKGFTLVPSGVDAYKIVPTADAKQEGVEVSVDRPPVNESFIARLIVLKNISSEDALKFLQPVVSRSGHISSFGPGNLLLVMDTGLNIEKIMGIAEAIDQPSLGEEAEVVLLEHAAAEDVARILNEGLSRADKSVRGQKAVADPRLNAVVLFGDVSTKESMKRLIALLDVTSEGTKSAINVYFLENANAEEMSKVLQGLLKIDTRQPQAAQKGTAPFEAATGISITPDRATNSLVIVASPSDFQNLVRVIGQLDKRRRQVFVEAMIVEASLDKLRDLGVKWRAIAEKDDEPLFVGGVGNIDTAAIQDIIGGLAGLTLGGLGNFFSLEVTTSEGETQTLSIPGYAALFSLNDFRDAVNVLSTPQILTSDNAEAEILVGENVPFVASRERDITTTNTVLSSIQRTDVGITLRITPHITEGDYVNLDIYQEISSVQATTEDIFINVGPTTTKRSTKTTVTVRDDQTVVIGGLMQERNAENVNKVPVLGDIPLFGLLFKSKRVSKEKTNLLVFLTPHVVKDSEALAGVTREKEKEYARLENQYVEGELLVKFKPEVPEERALAVISEKGASVIKFIEEQGVYHIRLKEGQKAARAVKQFLSLPEVQYAEPNYRMKLQ